MSIKVVQVALSEVTASFDMLYSYLIPLELENSIGVGIRVSVPFGRGNILKVGVVLKIDTLDIPPKGYKYIYSIEDKEPILNDEQIELVYHLVESTFCTYYDAIRTILPTTYTMKVSYSYCLDTSKTDMWLIDLDEAEFIQKLQSKKDDLQISKTIERNKDSITVKSLMEKEIIYTKRIFDSKSLDSKSKMVNISTEFLNENKKFKLSEIQKKVIKFIEDNGTVSVKEAEYTCGVSKRTISKLESLGIINIFDYQSNNYNFDDVQNHSVSSLALTQEQYNVFEEIASNMDLQKSKCFLIHGVTGSGKTAIFEKLIQKCLDMGKSAILLVPEIALTPQMVKRFTGVFGKRVALIHSGLSLKQREDEYCRIRDGLADIVIGTRSAIFVPLQNIGLIIMDEEGESSYKSERSPRYSTKDIAKFRCKYHNAIMILASATPSIESYYLAKRGVYTLLTLNHRYNNNPLPQTTLVDMRKERLNGNTSELSRTLMVEILKNLERGEQSILLLNRRGYNTSVMCQDCGNVIECKNCSVPMTYHKTNNSLMCHYCGFSIRQMTECPKCHSKNVRYTGFGTQKVVEDLLKIFPKAKILRMDTDTTFSKYAYEKSFGEFANGKYDILVGTQMVGKGLDFPNVTLTGIISADSMLYTGEYRSLERTFSLITQVIGRSGRGDKLGRAILQTYNPDNYVILQAMKQDYNSFFKEEFALRKLNIFPPICDICTIGLSSVDESVVQKGCDTIISIIRKALKILDYKSPLRVLNPVKFTHERIDGKFRYKIIMKCKNNSDFRNLIRYILKEFYNCNIQRLILFVDINGDVY
ncbi:MAG: primosomal protein N' [Oscillospiraceae bacterium]